MAPEVIKQTGHNRFADIWSLGCTVFEMATGIPPWSEKKQGHVLLLIAGTTKPPTYPDDMSDELKAFLDLCFRIEPKHRANVYELLRHPFITSNIDVAAEEPHVSSAAISKQRSVNTFISEHESDLDMSDIANSFSGSPAKKQLAESLPVGSDHLKTFALAVQQSQKKSA